MKTIPYYIEMNKKEKLADIYDKIGDMYNYKGNIDFSIDYYQRSIEIWDEINSLM